MLMHELFGKQRFYPIGKRNGESRIVSLYKCVMKGFHRRVVRLEKACESVSLDRR